MRFFLITIVALILIYQPTCFGYNYQINNDMLNRLLNEGKFDSILVLTNQIPQNPSTLTDQLNKMIILAKAERGLHHINKSTDLFRQVLENDSVSLHQKTECLIKLSELSIQKGEYPKAYQYIIKARDLQNELKSQYLEPYILFHLAFSNAVDNKKQREEFYNKSLKLFDENNSDLLFYLDWYADILIDRNSLQEAKVFIDEFQRILIKHPNHDKLYFKGKLKYAYYLIAIGKYQESIDVFEGEIFIPLKKYKSDWSEFIVMNAQRVAATAYILIRDFLKAGESYKKSLAKAEIILGESHFRVAELHDNLSFIYNKLGDYDLALDYSKIAVKIYANYEDASLANRAKLDQADLMRSLNGIDEAVILYKELSKIPDHYFGQKLIKGFALFHLAEIYIERLDLDSAFYYADQNEVLRKQVSDDNFMYLDWYTLFLKLQHQLVSKELSIKAYEEYLYEKGDQLRNDAKSLDFEIDYIEILIKQGKTDKARELILKCIARHSKVISEKSANEYMNALLRSYNAYLEIIDTDYETNQTIGRNQQIHDKILDGMELIDLINSSFKTNKDGIRQVQFQKKFINLAIPVVYNLYEFKKESNYLETIYKLMELSKNNTLLEAFNRNIALNSSIIPDSVNLELNNLKLQATFLHNKLRALIGANSQKDSLKIISYEKAQVVNKTRVQELMMNLEKANPAYYNLNYNFRVKNLNTLLSMIDKNLVILQYFEGKESIYLLTLSHKICKIHKLKPIDNSDLDELWRQFEIESVLEGNRQDFVNFQMITNKIYRILIKVPLDSLGVSDINKLYIIPDKSLYGLPLDMLATDINTEGLPNYKNIKYLMYAYNVSYDYSISSIYNKIINRNTKNKSTRKVLAVAPHYDDRVDKRGFSNLENNVYEVESISSYFDTKILKREEANERNFLQEFHKYDILHFAMHANINDANPDYSHLVFSAEEGQKYDDLMHVFEIYNLSLNLEMAVLSACNTSKGKYEVGEGVINLSRAFAYAGAKSIVTSSWEADDYTTSQIMKDFYKNLSNGLSKSASLRQAKLSYLEEAPPGKLHPFYWGTFSLIGKDDVLITGESSNNYLFWVSLILIVSLLTFLIIRKR